MAAELRDLQLERELLGACVIRPELMLHYEVTESDLDCEGHRQIWRALLQLHADGEPVNTVALRSKLLDMGKLQAAGGEDYLLGLTDTIPVEHLPVDRLRRLSRLRGIRTAAQRVIGQCEDADLDRAIGALADAHAAALLGAPKGKTKNLLELCEGILDDLSKPIDPRDLVHPGYEIFERQFGMIPRRTTIGILADTNVGKSTFMQEILIRQAQRNIVTGYLSVEDQEPRVRARLAGLVANVSSQDILKRRLSRDDFGRLAHGFGEIDRLKNHLHVSCLAGGTDADVCAAMTELAHRGCRVIAVDYIQKITPSNRDRSNKAHEVADIATRITSHAQRLDVVLFIASQCARDKNKQNQCPSKHDMKESGDLENMLDAVIGLWREYEDDYAPTWVRVLKAKDGGNGKSWCVQRSGSGRFEEIEGSDRMEPPDAKGDWAHRRNTNRGQS